MGWFSWLKFDSPSPPEATFKLPMPTRVELIGDTVAVFARKVRFESFTWGSVESVRAWKQDCFGVDRIWIGFDVPGREEPVCVHEECEGYQELLAEIEKRCPGSTPEWLRTVMFPAFATNHTLVWERPPRGGIPPLSHVPNVNEADVQRIVQRDYAADMQARVLTMLDQIGEHTSARVRLAVLKIGRGDLDRFQRGIELARSDYRNALMAAEYGRASTYTPPTKMFPAHPPGGIEGARQADWDEYHTWLLAVEPQVAPPD
ncbi:MAG: hypothetical protein QM783_02155 [Phycisphaerales bacterium]